MNFPKVLLCMKLVSVGLYIWCVLIWLYSGYMYMHRPIMHSFTPPETSCVRWETRYRHHHVDRGCSFNSQLQAHNGWPSAVASFFAPSDECGLRGMRREHIWSCPVWRGKAPRRDCALVVEDEDKPGMRGMNVARIQLFFSFSHNGKHYPCALVEWFSRMGRSPDSDTGMWKVCPDIRRGQRLCSVIHLNSILRGTHLPIFGHRFLPINFDYTYSLDAFAGYYVNHFADHHSHEIIF